MTGERGGAGGAGQSGRYRGCPRPFRPRLLPDRRFSLLPTPPVPPLLTPRVVSGGQTGADRAALDAALERGVAVGGWCPAGRLSEDGPIDGRYPLVETATADPAERTRLNVRDSDATLVLAPPGGVAGGTALTVEAARALGRPVLVVPPRPDALDGVVAWLAGGGVAVLNVAGPRESEAPGLYDAARSFVGALLDRLGSGADSEGARGV